MVPCLVPCLLQRPNHTSDMYNRWSWYLSWNHRLKGLEFRWKMQVIAWCSNIDQSKMLYVSFAGSLADIDGLWQAWRAVMDNAIVYEDDSNKRLLLTQGQICFWTKEKVTQSIDLWDRLSLSFVKDSSSSWTNLGPKWLPEATAWDGYCQGILLSWRNLLCPQTIARTRWRGINSVSEKFSMQMAVLRII